MRKLFIVVYIYTFWTKQGGETLEKSDNKTKIVLLKKRFPMAIWDNIANNEKLEDAVMRVMKSHKIPPEDLINAKLVDTQIVLVVWKYEFTAVLCYLDKTVEEIKNGIRYSDWQFVAEFEVKEK